ncbi:MAG: citryl-CoA lyase [Syntrophales bacterium]|jgi:citrate synthase|nr:citryl-CoA lyase [Syntrophales bacterium]
MEQLETKVGNVGEGKILVRGYPLQDLIGSLSYAGVLFLVLKGDLPTENEEKMMNAVLTAITDHFFVNAAVPAARFVATGNPNFPTGAIAAGILSLGSVTGSPQGSGEFVEESYRHMKEKDLSIGDAAAEIASSCKENKVRIPGFGHRSHPEGDPRAMRLRKLAEEYGVVGEKIRLYEAINKETVALSAGKLLPINVDGMMGCILAELGINPLCMGGIGAISFMPGIIAHTVEEIEAPERSSIRRFFNQYIDAKYTGPAEREVPKERLK